ncbi:MAG TPA: 2-phosphosulfolactate phosphatase, partial [Limnochordia bacterium]|nr:2-phosphosulfolactate phosphatase [Limnochordia bacterium]
MEIRCALLPAELEPAALAGCRVAVIDVLRATSTIVTALAAGAAAIVPVEELDEARRLAARGFLAGGERHAVAPDGFDFGNSPFEYTPERVRGREIALTTTNGTRALRRAAGAAGLCAAALLNAGAAARWLAEDDQPTILCAGTNQRVSADDTLCAGALVEHLLARRSGWSLDDGARLALGLFRAERDRLAAALRD